MTALQHKFDDLLNERRKYNEEFESKARELFKGVTKEFFEKNPGITAVKWNQYTPYFNDGDTCEFRVYSPSVTNCPVDQLDDISDWGEYTGNDENVFSIDCNISYIMNSDSKYYEKERKLLTELVNNNQIDIESVENFTRSIESSDMEDIMRGMFGDHVTVVATREGFDADECEHD